MVYQRVSREQPSRERTSNKAEEIKERKKLQQEGPSEVFERVDVEGLDDKEIKSRVEALKKNEVDVPILLENGNWEMQGVIGKINEDEGTVHVTWNENGTDMYKQIDMRQLLKWREDVMESTGVKDEGVATEKMTAADYEKLREKSEYGEKIAELAEPSEEEAQKQGEALEKATAEAESMDIRSTDEAKALESVISEEDYAKLNVPDVEYNTYADAKKELIQMKSQLNDAKQTTQSLQGSGLKRAWRMLFPPKMLMESKIRAIQLERKIAAQEGVVGPIDGYIESQQTVSDTSKDKSRRGRRGTGASRERRDAAAKSGRAGYGKQ